MSDVINNRFYREPYRDEFNTTVDAEDGYRAAVRLATVLMEKHWPEATGWQPAPDLLGVITQLDHITAHLHGCFAGPLPEPSVSMPPAADDGAPCTLADRVGTSATSRRRSRHDPVAESEAKALYDTWKDQPGWVPWVERGNSLMQERARRETW